ncbi:MAG: hypothetical protein QF879_17120 [Candidatus Latescibacteria bacterium]|nr:hypothetical protein [Candidatus Latescibacterota bacterium]
MAITLFLRNIPDPLQRKFKAVCAMKGVSMTAAVKGFMTAVVDGELDIDEGSGTVKAKGK